MYVCMYGKASGVNIRHQEIKKIYTLISNRRSLFAKEPLIIGLFCGKYQIYVHTPIYVYVHIPIYWERMWGEHKEICWITTQRFTFRDIQAQRTKRPDLRSYQWYRLTKTRYFSIQASIFTKTSTTFEHKAHDHHEILPNSDAVIFFRSNFANVLFCTEFP